MLPCDKIVGTWGPGDMVESPTHLPIPALLRDKWPILSEPLYFHDLLVIAGLVRTFINVKMKKI